MLATDLNPGTRVVFPTDCKSVLEAVQLPAGDETTSDLHTALFNLSQQCTLALQWVPLHCAIDGNEETEKLSKAGSKRKQCPHHISAYPEATTLSPEQLPPTLETTAGHHC